MFFTKGLFKYRDYTIDAFNNNTGFSLNVFESEFEYF